MVYTIGNDTLTVKIESKGAELQSIQTKDGTEYLWQGDPKYWPDRAPNLFPQVGMCTDGHYLLNGVRYPMDAHGFIKDTVLEVTAHTEDQITFVCGDTADTRRVYPFLFRYAISYRLSGQTLAVCVQVENCSTREMPFAMGAHPGFRVPLEENLSYEDYFLQFPAGASARRADCVAGPWCQMLGTVSDYPLPNGQIPLSHDLFAERVLILQDMPHTVVLQSKHGTRQVILTYPDMKYLGLWKWIGTDAPYPCIEPWTGLPARAGIIEDYAEHPDMVRLPPRKSYRNEWTIRIA